MSPTDGGSHELDVLGELVADFVPEKPGDFSSVAEFRRSLGGEAANVASGFARLGGAVALHTVVGDDPLGRALLAEIRRDGVIAPTPVVTGSTPLFVYTVDQRGGRECLMRRPTPAEETLSALTAALPEVTSPILHTGTKMLAFEASRGGGIQRLEEHRASGKLVSIDANIRTHLWGSPSRARRAILEVVPLIDLFKLNDEELELLQTTPKRLLEMGPSAVIVTAAKHVRLVTDEHDVQVSTEPITPVDVTGAGDAFQAGLLLGVSRGLCSSEGMEKSASPHELRFDERHWRAVLALASHVAVCVCRMYGSTRGFPRLRDIPRELRSGLRR